MGQLRKPTGPLADQAREKAMEYVPEWLLEMAAPSEPTILDLLPLGAAGSGAGKGLGQFLKKLVERRKPPTNVGDKMLREHMDVPARRAENGVSHKDPRDPVVQERPPLDPEEAVKRRKLIEGK